jgi:hypothetical protein
MVIKTMWKLLVMAVALFTILVNGLAAQQHGSDYEIIKVEYLGDFETDNPRDRAISETVSIVQGQNPTLTYGRITYQNHHELLAIIRAWEAISENVGIDSTWAVIITISAYREEKKYIIFFQGLPFASNPYYYWVYRGDRK